MIIVTEYAVLNKKKTLLKNNAVHYTFSVYAAFYFK